HRKHVRLMALFRVDDIVHQFYVQKFPLHPETFRVELLPYFLERISDLGYGGVGEDGCEIGCTAGGRDYSCPVFCGKENSVMFDKIYILRYTGITG
ncbi:MAG: hypothetical protein ACI4QV_07245, partial [Acutalibacteraceae bacterium]